MTLCGEPARGSGPPPPAGSVVVSVRAAPRTPPPPPPSRRTRAARRGAPLAAPPRTPRRPPPPPRGGRARGASPGGRQARRRRRGHLEHAESPPRRVEGALRRGDGGPLADVDERPRIPCDDDARQPAPAEEHAGARGRGFRIAALKREGE